MEQNVFLQLGKWHCLNLVWLSAFPLLILDMSEKKDTSPSVRNNAGKKLQKKTNTNNALLVLLYFFLHKQSLEPFDGFGAFWWLHPPITLVLSTVPREKSSRKGRKEGRKLQPHSPHWNKGKLPLAKIFLLSSQFCIMFFSGNFGFECNWQKFLPVGSLPMVEFLYAAILSDLTI